MADRLSALDASFLFMEDPTTPLHVGGVAIFDRPRAGFDYQQVLSLVGRRLNFLPRYRQRVMEVPGQLARPVWVDDADFDLNYHVRRSALPSPGSDRQLFELASRLMSRPMDHERPLWEMYFVEGLADGRVALITKTHQAMVDGVGTIELSQLILDATPNAGAEDLDPAEDTWQPRRSPGKAQLMLDAVSESVQRPGELVENARAAARDAVVTGGKVIDALGGVASTVGAMLRPAPSGPLNARVSGGRLFCGVATKLDDFREIRSAYGGTVNDAVLAVIAGALRGWLLSRGAGLPASATVRALAPVAVADAEAAEASSPGLIGNQVAPHLVELPVGEPNPVLRLQHISHTMAEQLASGHSVAARALLRVGGFAPTTLHALGARATGSFSDRLFNLLITNSPGPQMPMYAGSARMTEMYPVMPLVRNHALAVGVTSYDGAVYFGLNGDRKAMSDVDVLGSMISDSLEELKGAEW